MPLSQSQRKYLRGRGHSLKPIVLIGGAGLTKTVLAELDGALEHHELIKVRVRVGSRDQRDALLNELLEESRTTLLQRTGNVALLYREAKEPKLSLPKTQ